MSRAEKALVVLLRVAAVLVMTAVVAVVMPFEWMAAIHRALELGELPEGPIVGYLTRSASALYALHGVLVLYVSFDVRRYLPLVKCLAVLSLVFGAVMLPLDYLVGLPIQWVLCEGPFIIALGAVLLWLAVRTDREIRKAAAR
jgi:hypothetical protein